MYSETQRGGEVDNNRLSERVKGALHPSNAKRLYMDEKSTEIGEIN